MTKTTVDSAMLKDVLLLVLNDYKNLYYRTGKPVCEECEQEWESHLDDCPVAYAQQLLKEIGDE